MLSESVLRVPLNRRFVLLHYCFIATTTRVVLFVSCDKMAFNGEGPHNKRQRTDTDPANNRVSRHKIIKSHPVQRGIVDNNRGGSHPELFSLIKSS